MTVRPTPIAPPAATTLAAAAKDELARPNKITRHITEMRTNLFTDRISYLEISVAGQCGCWTVRTSGSVFVDCEIDKQGRQKREDVGLQECDEQFQAAKRGGAEDSD